MIQTFPVVDQEAEASLQLVQQGYVWDLKGYDDAYRRARWFVKIGELRRKLGLGKGVGNSRGYSLFAWDITQYKLASHARREVYPPMHAAAVQNIART